MFEVGEVAGDHPADNQQNPFVFLGKIMLAQRVKTDHRLDRIFADDRDGDLAADIFGDFLVVTGIGFLFQGVVDDHRLAALGDKPGEAALLR